MIHHSKYERGLTFKHTAIGCFAFIVIGAIICLFIKEKMETAARQQFALYIETSGAEAMASFGIEESQQKQAMASLSKVANRIRNEEISLAQGGSILQHLTTGAFVKTVPFRGFENLYLTQGSLPEEELQQGKQTVALFLRAIEENEVDLTTLNALREILFKQSAGDVFSGLALRRDIDQTQVRESLAIMKKSVTEAGITDPAPRVDLVKIIDVAIQNGLKQSPISQDGE